MPEFTFVIYTFVLYDGSHCQACFKIHFFPGLSFYVAHEFFDALPVHLFRVCILCTMCMACLTVLFSYTTCLPSVLLVNGKGKALHQAMGSFLCIHGELVKLCTLIFALPGMFCLENQWSLEGIASGHY